MYYIYGKETKMIAIQHATLTNVDTIAQLFDAYRQFYQQPSDLKAAYDFIKDRLDNNESEIFMAYWDGEPAGFVQLYPMFSSVSMKRVWILNDLYVTETFRNKGIGNALLEVAKAHGRATSAKGLMLETARDNHTAQSVYENNGWEKENNFFYWYSL
jgi:GNAT superfamily N-acetyltransferase